MTMGKAIFTFEKRRKLHTFSHFSFGEGVPPNKVINEYSKHVLENNTLKIAHFSNVVFLVKMHSTVSHTIKGLFFIGLTTCFGETSILWNPLHPHFCIPFHVVWKLVLYCWWLKVNIVSLCLINLWVSSIIVYFRNWIHYRGKCCHCWRNILSLESPPFIFCMPYFMNIRIILLVDPGKYNFLGK